MSPKTNRTEMNEIPAKERVLNFSEVTLGYSKEEAIAEAERCLMCQAQPCVKGCPVNVPIPEFIAAISQKEFARAYQCLTKENSLPAVCGRVCPQEKQCEAYCIRGIKGEAVAIGRLERFIGDWSLDKQISKKATAIADKKVAVIGSGPAGLACAAELAREGIAVKVYEALHALGGVLRYGIPEFRLPKKVLDREIEKLKILGVEFKANILIGKSLTLEDLFKDGYKAIFIGTGAGLPRFIGIPGENLNGVYTANEYLTRVNLMNARLTDYPTPIKICNRVAVIGGGNVALDVARIAKRLGAEVTIVYRRGMEELPARHEEIIHAQDEMIDFKLLSQPLAIHGREGRVLGLECLAMRLGEVDDSGRKKPVAIEGSNFMIKADLVIIAIGQAPNPVLARNTPRLETNKWGGIVIDEKSMRTSIKNVYAGGDAVTGAATVISAMGAGKKAAKSIIHKLR